MYQFLDENFLSVFVARILSTAAMKTRLRDDAASDNGHDR